MTGASRVQAAATAAFSIDDHVHMARALRLAARGINSTPPNPSVGCVIVGASGTVVGEGFHARAGEPHAEVMALRDAGGAVHGGTAYVTLEPCSHHGRTPPCVDAVLGAGLRRVVVAMSDPNPRVAGEGLRRLEAAGLQVELGLLAGEAAELNRGFVSRMARGRPWVTLKLGSSIDGRTALADGSSQWITGVAARADVQRLRARAAAIVTGIGTVLADDPRLSVRDESLELRGRRPLRVVFDARGRMPGEATLLRDGIDTLLLTSASGLEALQARGVRSTAQLTVTALPVDASGRIEPGLALRRLAELECNEVLVEAGPKLAGAFLAAGLADEAVLYLAPTVLGETARPAFELPRALRSLDERRSYRYVDVRTVGADLRLTLRPVEAND